MNKEPGKSYERAKIARAATQPSSCTSLRVIHNYEFHIAESYSFLTGVIEDIVCGSLDGYIQHVIIDSRQSVNSSIQHTLSLTDPSSSGS